MRFKNVSIDIRQKFLGYETSSWASKPLKPYQLRLFETDNIFGLNANTCPDDLQNGIKWTAVVREKGMTGDLNHGAGYLTDDIWLCLKSSILVVY